MNCATCLTCRGVFDVSYDSKCRDGSCPVCRRLVEAVLSNRLFVEALNSGKRMADALFLSSRGAR